MLTETHLFLQTDHCSRGNVFMIPHLAKAGATFAGQTGKKREREGT